MNFRNEAYPENRNELLALIDEGCQIAKFLKVKLEEIPATFVEDIIDDSGKTNKIDLVNTVDASGENYNWVKNIPYKVPLQTGVYAFGKIEDETVRVLYVGITRRLYQRIKEHGWGKISNHATFAHLMAKMSLNDDERQILKSKSHPLKEELKAVLENKRNINLEIVRKCRLAIWNLDDDREFDLSFLEHVVASELKSYWNSFKTH